MKKAKTWANKLAIHFVGRMPDEKDASCAKCIKIVSQIRNEAFLAGWIAARKHEKEVLTSKQKSAKLKSQPITKGKKCRN